jgi:hypothetical protein
MLYYYGPWVEAALCRAEDADPDMWFEEPQRARKVCLQCPVKDECLFTALELVQRGECVKGIWGGLSSIQLHRALQNPNNIPKMRGQRSRAMRPPIFPIPLIPPPLPDEDELGAARSRSGRGQREDVPPAGTVSPFHKRFLEDEVFPIFGT